MRWKRLEISPFSIHNAFGYTSSASQARRLLFEEKAIKCSAYIGGSSVERTYYGKKITPTLQNF
jgi:hypothetical protein